MSFLFVEKIRKSLYKSFFNVNKKRKTRVIYKAVSGDDLLHVIFLKVASANACSHEHMLFLDCIHSKDTGTILLLFGSFFKQ